MNNDHCIAPPNTPIPRLQWGDDVCVDLQPVLMRPKNQINSFWRDRVIEKAKEYGAMWNDGSGVGKNTLSQRNRGVRCFMKRTYMFATTEELQAAIDTFSQDKSAHVYLESDCGLDTAMLLWKPESALLAMYTPTQNPLSTIYGGVPTELTELVLRSSMLWQLKSNSLKLKSSDKDTTFVKLFTATSFYIPGVSVDKMGAVDNFQQWELQKNINVMLMSDIQSSNHNSNQLDISNMIYTKLVTPFYMALRQNINRVKLGLVPIRTLVIGDMNLEHSKPGVNALYCKKLHELLEKFGRCFDHIHVCMGHSTRLYCQIVQRM